MATETTAMPPMDDVLGPSSTGQAAVMPASESSAHHTAMMPAGGS